ncbi:MAG: hypothetical protein RSD07_12835 [Angelakisella sp.]
MERLTDKDLTKACNDTWDYCGLDSVCKRDCWKPTPCKIPKMVHKLAEYEDTGYTPEQIADIIQDRDNAYQCLNDMKSRCSRVEEENALLRVSVCECCKRVAQGTKALTGCYACRWGKR